MQKNDNYFTTCLYEKSAKIAVQLLTLKGYNAWYEPVHFVMPFNTVYYVYYQEI